MWLGGAMWLGRGDFKFKPKPIRLFFTVIVCSKEHMCVMCSKDRLFIALYNTVIFSAPIRLFEAKKGGNTPHVR